MVKLPQTLRQIQAALPWHVYINDGQIRPLAPGKPFGGVLCRLRRRHPIAGLAQSMRNSGENQSITIHD